MNQIWNLWTQALEMLIDMACQNLNVSFKLSYTLFPVFCQVWCYLIRNILLYNILKINVKTACELPNIPVKSMHDLRFENDSSSNCSKINEILSNDVKTSL